MPHEKRTLTQFSVYIPVGREKEQVVQRLIELGKKQRRSINWMCVEAIDEYLARHEQD